MGLRILHFVLLLIHLSMVQLACGQSFFEIRCKEEFDQYNRRYNSTKDYCTVTVDWSNPQSVKDVSGLYANGLSKTLQGYITMHELTGDDAYLYKFMKEAMCIMEHRADFHNSWLHPDYPNVPPRWSSDVSTYQDGYIIGSLSKFCHYIKSVAGYYNKPLYPTSSKGKVYGYDQFWI